MLAWGASVYIMGLGLWRVGDMVENPGSELFRKNN